MNIKKIVLSLAAVAVLIAPVAAMAIDYTVPQQQSLDVPGLVDKILTPVWQIFIGLAVIMIIVAGVLFLTAGGAAEKIATARQALIWGVVGIAIGVLAFSITYIVKFALGS